MDYQAHHCDFCTGTVQAHIARHETIRVRQTVVLIDGAVIGKCDRCGHRYFPSAVVKAADHVAQHPEQAERMLNVPVIAA